MNTITINTDSVTYAIKAKKLLERSGIVAALIKSDTAGKKDGCTYGVRIESSRFYDAALILKNGGISFSVRSDI